MILVTGAGGFIGQALVQYLKEHHVRVLPAYRSKEFASDTERVFMDLTSPEHVTLLEQSIERPKTVIHLAGRVEIRLEKNRDGTGDLPVPGPENYYGIYESNVTGTANLLRYCLERGVGHLVFASSQAVYGMPHSGIITEETPCNPLEHYALSKLCCEEMLRLASGRMQVTVLRFPGIYSDTRREGTVYRFCRDALERKEIRVTSEIPLPFDVLHIDDVIKAFFCATRRERIHGFSVFNISSGEPDSLDLLADRIAGMVPGCTAHHAETPQPIIRMDPSKAGRELGWQPVSPETRLRHMLDVMRRDR